MNIVLKTFVAALLAGCTLVSCKASETPSYAGAYQDRDNKEPNLFISARKDGKYDVEIVTFTNSTWLLLENGAEIRRMLIEQKIFVPTLWPNVLKEEQKNTAAYTLANSILPLPCDQRYGPEEMNMIIEAVFRCLRKLQEKQA